MTPRVAILALLPLLSGATAALADPPWARGPGHYNYEYDDGYCKYEYKAGPGGVKEERKCRGPAWRGHVPLPPPKQVHVIVPPPMVKPALPPPGVVYGTIYQDAQGRYCREYQTTGIIDGRQERLYGTACRMPDGSWEFVN